MSFNHFIIHLHKFTMYPEVYKRIYVVDLFIKTQSVLNKYTYSKWIDLPKHDSFIVFYCRCVYDYYLLFLNISHFI